MEINYSEWITHIGQMIATFGMRSLSALFVFVLGWQLINRFIVYLERRLKRYRVDASLITFLSSFATWTLRTLLLLTIASMLGIKTTSFLALLGSAGLAIGLSLQGSLSNLAGGVLILFLKPFKVGDTIETSSVNIGTVKRIMLFHTVIHTPGNQVIYLPNGPLANSNLINYSVEAYRRLDFDIGIGYENDLCKAKNILLELAQKDPRVIQVASNNGGPELPPIVAVSSLGDHAVVLKLRLWVNRENYWPMMFSLNEQVKLAFDAAKIEIPYQKRDVYLHQVIPS